MSARAAASTRRPPLRAIRQRVSRQALATAVALLADRAFGEVPLDPHPVARFGSLMQAVEDRWYEDSRRAGVRHTAIGVAVGAGTGLVVPSTLLAASVAIAARSLADAAHDVAEPLLLDDLDAARRNVRALVGRDPEGLDADELARAAVESVAENTTDAVVAPAWWAMLGGAPGVLAYRAVNTMDAMVGHHSARYERYGWASARLDDIANYVPARVTALLVVLARPSRARAIWRAVRDDAPHHPSPNAGVAEAAFAAALDLTLGGTNVYGGRVEARAALGHGRRPQPGDIATAVRLEQDVALVLAATLLAVAIAANPHASALRHRRNRTATRRGSPAS